MLTRRTSCINLTTVLYREHARHKKRGRKKLYPPLKVKNNRRVEFRNILRYSTRMRQTKWQTYHVKDGTKGPMAWQAKRILIYLANENGLPTRPHHLLVARNALNHNEVKYFICDAITGALGEISPKLRENLELADRNADRAIRIISNFHDTSKIDANKTELEQAELDLRAAVSEITEALSPLAVERDVN